MHKTLEFLVHHGYLVLLGWVFAEQVGLPVPSIPLLLAAGALAGVGRLNYAVALLLCVIACLSADSLWYTLGRTRGIRILRFLCKVSLEPDSCVRKTEGLFERQGAKSLILAKFVPGLGTVAAPLAGIFRMRIRKFVAFDALASFIWASTFLGLGYIFSGQIEWIGERVEKFGSGLVAVALLALAGYIVFKYFARQKFLRDLRVARITVDELKSKLDGGQSVTVVDLRHSLDLESDPVTIPGALLLSSAELTKSTSRLPHDREIVLYCTCPNEATSAKVALLLRSQGITRIRPLQGGLQAWRDRGYPTQTQMIPDPPAAEAAQGAV